MNKVHCKTPVARVHCKKNSKLHPQKKVTFTNGIEFLVHESLGNRRLPNVKLQIYCRIKNHSYYKELQ